MTFKKRPKTHTALSCNQGQATLEFLFGAWVFAVFILSFVAIVYLGLCHLHSQTELYEALICLSEEQPVWTCKKQFKEKTEKFLPYAHVTSILLMKNQYQLKGQLNLQLLRRFNWRSQLILTWPLK